MPLPKIDQPIFTMTVPSSGAKIKYRPFTVKEEKILLIAQESKELEQMITAIKQVVGNCLLDCDVESLALFDYEYILLNIRAKAVNNVVQFQVKDPETEQMVDLELDINEVTIDTDPKHNPLISVGDTITIKMKYPKLDVVTSLKQTNLEGSPEMFNVMTGCIDAVVEGDDVFKLKDFTPEEVDAFVDSLSSVTLNDIKTFFDTMPKMRIEKKYTNSKGDERTFVASGTETFFI